VGLRPNYMPLVTSVPRTWADNYEIATSVAILHYYGITRQKLNVLVDSTFSHVNTNWAKNQVCLQAFYGILFKKRALQNG